MLQPTLHSHSCWRWLAVSSKGTDSFVRVVGTSGNGVACGEPMFITKLLACTGSAGLGKPWLGEGEDFPCKFSIMHRTRRLKVLNARARPSTLTARLYSANRTS